MARALQRRRVGLCEPDVGVALLAPATRNRAEYVGLGLDQHRLLLRRQLHRAPVFVGMAERRKDALSYAEIGLAVMRALHGIGKGECSPAKTAG